MSIFPVQAASTQPQPFTKLRRTPAASSTRHWTGTSPMAPSTFPLVSSDLHEGDPFQPHPARQHPVRSSSQTSQSPFADNTDSSERTRLNAQYSQGSPYISPQSSSGSFTPPPRSSSTVPSSRSTSPRRARAHQLASASSSNEFGDSRENFSPPTTVVGAGRAGWVTLLFAGASGAPAADSTPLADPNLPASLLYGIDQQWRRHVASAWIQPVHQLVALAIALRPRRLGSGPFDRVQADAVRSGER